MRARLFLLIVVLFALACDRKETTDGSFSKETDSYSLMVVIELLEKSQTYQAKDVDSALYFAKEASYLAADLDENLLLAKSDVIIGQILDKLGNYTLAIEYFHNALKIYYALDDEVKVAETKLLLSHANADAFHFDISLELANDAVKIFREKNDSLNLACAYFNVGYVYERYDSSYLALKHYDKSDSLNNLLRDEELTKQLTEAYASVYEDLEDFEMSLSYYMRVSEMANNTLYEEIDLLNNIGDIYRKTDRPEMALPHYIEAYDMAIQVNITRKIQQNAQDLALTYEALDDQKNAMKYYKMHMAFFEKFYIAQSASQINQLHVLFDSDQKNKELELQKVVANRRTSQRNVVIASLIFLVIIVIMLWYAIKQKILANKQLNIQNRKIIEQSEELSRVNKEITQMNISLEKIIQERTKELTIKNKKLKEYLSNNSHIVRAPLARILGLLKLYNDQPKDHLDLINEGLHQSAKELDDMIREINEKLSAEEV